MIRVPIKVQKHISDVRAGDTIVHNGCEITLSPKFIKKDPFFGTTIYGDSYRLGTIPVTVIEWHIK